MISLDSLPHLPGCYLFPDSQGTVIYVGKARDIKRVSNYFQKQDHGPRTEALVLAARRGLHRHQYRGRSAAPGKHPHQEASAPLQHQAQGLLPLCLHRAYRRTIPADQNLSQGLRAAARSSVPSPRRGRELTFIKLSGKPLVCAPAAGFPSEPAFATIWATARDPASARSARPTTRRRSGEDGIGPGGNGRACRFPEEGDARPLRPAGVRESYRTAR